MIATAKSKPKPFDVILVHKFDRFARSREDSVVYKSLLKREAGIKVVSTTESIEDDKFSVILEAMLEAMAEYYSLNLAEEVKKGMTEKAHRGEYQTTPPFGYTMEEKKLVVIPEEAAIIRLIFEKFTSKEMSMRGLALHLTSLGVKTKRGNDFHNRTITYILNNPVYMGQVRWTPTEKAKYNFNHPDSVVTDGKHEAIISRELWEKAQEILKRNKELFPYKVRDDAVKVTWLHGLVHCGSCDKRLVRANGLNMQCNGYSKGKCKTSNSIKYTVLENLTLEALQRDFTAPIELTIAPKRIDNINSAEYDYIDRQLGTFDAKLERIKTAYKDGIDTLDEYRANKIYLEEERENLIARLREIKETLLPTVEDEEPVQKRIKDVHTLLTDEATPFNIKYETANFLIDKITYEKEAKALRLKYKY